MSTVVKANKESDANLKTPSVAELRRSGYKVKVYHYREFKAKQPKSLFLESRRGEILQDRKTVTYHLSHFGGKTIVELQKGKNKYLFQSICHQGDRYNRKEGVMVCLRQFAMTKSV